MISIAVWRPARVISCNPAASDMVSLVLEPAEAVPHRAGQHYEIRFPGDELSRKFSIVSGPARPRQLEFGVQILPNGMMSPRLARTAPGDRLEIRGPLGEAFLWTPGLGTSLVLLAAGAGITPLLCMHEHFVATVSPAAGRCLFIVSARTQERIFRYQNFKSFLSIRLTAAQPRLTRDDLREELADMPPDETDVRVCGPPRFIDAMVDGLLDIGFAETRVRSEAFL